MSNEYKVGDIIRLGSQQPYHYAVYIGDEDKVHLNNEQDKNIKVSIEHERLADHHRERRRDTLKKTVRTSSYSGERYHHNSGIVERDTSGQSEAAYEVGGSRTSVVVGAGVGAVVGAIVGSVLPVVGTAIGTGLGAAIGTVVGLWGGTVGSRVGTR
jgi:hypothetical protein